MADYKETNITGKSWQRAQLVIISNHLGQVPTVTYHEEEYLVFENDTIQRQKGQLSYTIDPTTEISLRDPDTLELTGDTVPVALVHQALFSDYLNRALERDKPPVTEESEIPE